uniref:Uncharacterized protein n=1 Tax=Tanacetum cinerariifolium TaxID=118510 RepID=A0A699QF85_TANCI|nr:hypothetical protein [Tanacetum cinerariifolium]
MDKRLKDLMMMILVRQTEEYDIMFYTMKTDMVMLVAEIEVSDKTVDDVDKLACSVDVVKSRQISHQLDISDKLTPFRRECIQKLRVDLELFQFHVIHVHFIQE